VVLGVVMCGPQTSESRKILLNEYLAGVLESPSAVGESDVIYTFLHCLIRDQQETKRIREGIHLYYHNGFEFIK